MAADRNLSPDNQKRLAELVKQAKARKGEMPEAQIHVPKEALPANYTEDQYLRVLANVVLYGTHRWYIGHIDLPDQTKVDWGGLKCRRHWFEFNGNISHPDVDKIIGDINDCMGAAVAAAIAAGLLTWNLGAATSAFQASLVACLQLKGVKWASEISIWIDQEELTGDWHYCL